MTRSLLITALTLWMTGTIPVADARPRKNEGSKRDAEAAHDEGIRRFKKLDYEGAIEAFERSYFLSAHFLAMCNIARCHERRNDLVRAAEVYRRCLDEGGRASRMGHRLERALSTIEARITRVQVVSPGEGGTVYVNGQKGARAPAEVLLNPGRHILEVRRKGTRPALLTIEAAGGARQVELVPLPPIPPTSFVVAPPQPAPPAPPGASSGRRRLSSRWFWSTAALSLALAGAGTVVGILTITENQSFEEHPTLDRYNQVLDYRLAANILFATAGAAAGASVLLFFFTDFGRSSGRGDGGASAGLGLQGSF